ncbi:Ger(x)C family spore germination protein [Paenibacillus rhizovicinus]|uniref:Ger(X)C family spore germination protein n=1 Tax=Paenibacillus rhizovicinus TaxID=2704463 RepID=A0A6C0P5T8_9BACL|nr:Ger(x)C family spore germination protein [Paenibacillus rhizovicinus]QHW33676.1 Ger(x)C family spore germination protein [Paenibacillus rhizovicinus]
MKRGLAVVALCLLLSLTLTGCWDQLSLKKQLFVDIVGVDYAGESKRLAVSFVIASLREANQGGGKPSSLYMNATGESLYDSATRINQDLPGILSVQQTRLYLISPRFAKDEPLTGLSASGQFISNPLYAYLAMYDGDLSKLLSKKKVHDQTINDYLIGVLDDQLKRGRIPSNKMLHYILGGEELVNDFALNLFEPSGEGARLAGTALFRDGKYTGIKLDNEETLLACLLNGTGAANQPLNGQVEGKPYTVQVQQAKHDFRFVFNKEGLREIDLSLKLGVKLVEDGHFERKHTKQTRAKMEKAIEADLDSMAATLIAKLQKANCDYFQLGHELAAYHPKLYKGMNWRVQYPKLAIKPNVKITILNTGVLE